jgi:dUTP pyrophosphatase
MTPHAAGMDVCIAIEDSIEIKPGKIKLLPTGFSMALPEGFEAQIRPRSGLAIKHGIGVVNSPGTIDCDYRGEVKIGLINYGEEPFIFKRGDRVAQMVITRVWRAEVELTDTLEETERNGGGFGHTGVSFVNK